jgi:hypothetical protein
MRPASNTSPIAVGAAAFAVVVLLIGSQAHVIVVAVPKLLPVLPPKIKISPFA